MLPNPRRKSLRNIAKHATNDNIAYSINTIIDNEDNNTPHIVTMHTDITVPYHMKLFSDPIDNMIDISIATNGMHTTLGVLLENNKPINRVKLINCIPGTPAAKIPKWRTILRNKFMTLYNNKSVKSIADI